MADALRRPLEPEKSQENAQESVQESVRIVTAQESAQESAQASARESARESAQESAREGVQASAREKSHDKAHISDVSKTIAAALANPLPASDSLFHDSAPHVHPALLDTDTDMSADSLIAADAAGLSAQLAAMRDRFFPPTAQKILRSFSSGEAAKLIGVSDGYLRQLSLSGEGPQPTIGAGGRRSYTLPQVNGLRDHLARQNPAKARHYIKHRQAHEALQVIAVTNFKGGSGKTTTSVHLAQHLALEGYRVLAVDLDPQASMSALFGYQPELDLTGNDTLYGAIRYDDEARPLKQIIRSTYFDGLDLVPGNLELQEFEHTTPHHLYDRQQGQWGGKAGGQDASQMFFARVQSALHSVADRYDIVVIDCPPQLGFLTLGALCAATSVIVTVHPQMLDVASMSQFLFMTSDLLSVVAQAGGVLNFNFLRYLITRYEPNDGPQTQISAFLRNQFGNRVLTQPMVKTTAISDAGLSKQTLYEVGRENFSRHTYDRALEAMSAVNEEIEALVRQAWGRA